MVRLQLDTAQQMEADPIASTILQVQFYHIVSHLPIPCDRPYFSLYTGVSALRWCLKTTEHERDGPGSRFEARAWFGLEFLR